MDKITRIIHQGDADATDIRSEIAFGIQKGRIGDKQVHKIVEDIRADVKWNSLLIDHSVFEVCNDKTQWNEEYLRNITEDIVCGDMSEEILYHMVEVSKYVNRHCVTAKAVCVGMLCIAVVIALVQTVIGIFI